MAGVTMQIYMLVYFELILEHFSIKLIRSRVLVSILSFFLSESICMCALCSTSLTQCFIMDSSFSPLGLIM
jgi:hypothetical protein